MYSMSNMLTDTCSSCCLCTENGWVYLMDNWVLIVMTVIFLWGEDCECQFFWEAICLLRVRSKQWGCNRDDWFSAAVSGRPAISQNENQYIVPFVIIGAPGKKKKGIKKWSINVLAFWTDVPPADVMRWCLSSPESAQTCFRAKTAFKQIAISLFTLIHSMLPLAGNTGICMFKPPKYSLQMCGVAADFN